jgi:hypothetical protein
MAIIRQNAAAQGPKISADRLTVTERKGEGKYAGTVTLAIDVENSKYPTSALAAGPKKFARLFANDVTGDSILLSVIQFVEEHEGVDLTDRVDSFVLAWERHKATRGWSQE